MSYVIEYNRNQGARAIKSLKVKKWKSEKVGIFKIEIFDKTKFTLKLQNLLSIVNLNSKINFGIHKQNFFTLSLFHF